MESLNQSTQKLIQQLSFVNNPQDVDELFTHIRQLGNDQLTIVPKIETQQAFCQLPTNS